MVPSWKGAVKDFLVLFVPSPLVLPYYSPYILSDYAAAQVIWCITILEILVCTFTAFLCLAHAGPVFPEGWARFPCIWDLGMLYSLLSGICKKFWRRWVVWQSGTIKVLTYPWNIWPTIEVVTSIGPNLCCSSFPAISACVECPMFCRVVRVRLFFVMQMATPLVIVLYHLLL